MRAVIILLVAAAIALGCWALSAPEAQALLLHASLDYSTTASLDYSTTALLAGYLTEKATAKELSVTPRTLARWRKLRVGPAVTFVGIRPMSPAASRFSRGSSPASGRWLAQSRTGRG